MKTAVSIPDELFARAEEVARKLGLSRSELYARALSSFVEERQDEEVTARLNQVHGTASEGIDPLLAKLQRRALRREEW